MRYGHGEPVLAPSPPGIPSVALTRPVLWPAYCLVSIMVRVSVPALETALSQSERWESQPPGDHPILPSEVGL